MISRYFIFTTYLRHAGSQLPLPCISPLSCLNGDIYNEVILTGHPILLFITSLSVNELTLSFFSCNPMKSLTPALLRLSGEDTPASVILSVVTEYYTLSTKWDMTWASIASSSLSVFLNHFKVFSAGHLSSSLVY